MDEMMTLEMVRDWHNEEVRRLNKSQHPFPNGSTVLQALAEHHQAMADAIDAHLTQPAQLVDVEKVREVITSIDLRAETYLDPQCKGWANKLTAALTEKGNG